ncbi:indoleamine 2,3-dioxygenase 1 isoform X1 [Engraulis encrasicolus]|uniref:indoleamine 2,3-dioxygenase 1 isoform X1 n=2 Tax=Engraulis encrasicolus TaxID=184585 RepID=UPI002FD463CA
MDEVHGDVLQPLSLKEYHVSEEYGFALPDPLEVLPPYYQPWMEIARNVTELIYSHSLRDHVHEMPELETELLLDHRELRLAHLALSIITMGYVWQEGDNQTVKVLPRNLAVPYWSVSQKLGLPPILTHADAVLANWKRKDPHGEINMENVDLLFYLPGGSTVHGFFMVTLMVELAAVPAIKAVPQAINGVNQGDVATVTEALNSISVSLDDVVEALKLMHHYVDPSVFYGIMRIYLSGWKDNPSMPEGLVYEGVQMEPLEFSGGSAAQSSLLHCFDELLGVRHEGSSGAFLTRMRCQYMVPAHTHFVEEVSRRRPGVRDFVREQGDEELSEAYKRCVHRLVAVRNYHINLVARYITQPASQAQKLRLYGADANEDNTVSQAPTALEKRGTGGSGIMSFLKTVRDRTRAVTDWSTTSTASQSKPTETQEEHSGRVTVGVKNGGRVENGGGASQKNQEESLSFLSWLTSKLWQL